MRTIAARNSALFLACAALSLAARAQISSDGSLGTSVSRAGSAWTIGGGSAAGSNLFHSFAQFGLPRGQSAAFSGSAGNVIARVTGGSASVIDGQLSASGNLWLVNPAGVTLKANASLNLGGSFHASTAQYVRLADGSAFYASLAAASSFSAAAPTAFGFLGPSAPLAVNGAGLGVVPGQHISLVGGALTVQSAFLQTDGGDITLAAARSAGELDVASGTWSGGALAPLALSNSTLQTVGFGSASGRVVVRGGAVSLDATDVFADTLTANAGRGIAIAGSESFSMTSTQLFSGTVTAATAGPISIDAPRVVIAGGSLINTDTGYVPQHLTRNRGTGGAIAISGADVLITEGATFSARSVSRGRGGDLTVTSSGDVVVEDFALLSTDSTRGGASGNMTISGRNVVLRDSGGLRSTSDGPGTGGTVAVLAQDTASIAAGSAINVDTKGPGRGGDVVVIAGGSFQLRGKIFSGAQAAQTGDAGSVSVSAPDVSISEGGLVSTETIGTGKAGDIRISGTHIDIGTGGVVASSTSGAGGGGSISLAAERIDVHDGGLVNASSTTVAAAGTSLGLAGSIAIEAGSTFSLFGGSAITTEALSADGGDIRVTARDLVHLRDGRITTSVSKDFGHGGNILIDPTFVVLDGGQVVAQAQQGAGGNITIASSFFLTQGNWLVDASSQGGGISGVVAITAPKVDLSSGLVVLASNFLVTHRLSETCAARASRGSNSFIAAGRGGLPALDLMSYRREAPAKAAFTPGCPPLQG